MNGTWKLVGSLAILLGFVVLAWVFLLPVVGCSYGRMVEIREVKLVIERVVIAELHASTSQPAGGSEWQITTEPEYTLESPHE
jgi:hypothetical protein